MNHNYKNNQNNLDKNNKSNDNISNEIKLIINNT